MMCKRQGQRTQARILVADWDQASALALAATLHTAGFQVATACDGLEAVAEAVLLKPDLLVTEPYLGRLSGIQAAVEITAALPECSVLFLSGEASMADIAKAAPRELVYSFTAKPIHSLDLLNAITYLVSAVWSTGDSAWAGIDRNRHNHETQDPLEPCGSSRQNFDQRQEGEPAALAFYSSTRYFRSLLALKREHPHRHISNRHRHSTVCV